jgi:hypothetical protein
MRPSLAAGRFTLTTVIRRSSWPTSAGHAGNVRADQGLVVDEPEGEADQDRRKSSNSTFLALRTIWLAAVICPASVGAEHMSAGPDEVRRSGSYQPALGRGGSLRVLSVVLPEDLWPAAEAVRAPARQDRKTRWRGASRPRIRARAMQARRRPEGLRSG